MTAPVAARVGVLADDLIWATRLAGQVRAAGAEPVPCRSLDGLAEALAITDADAVGAVVVDLTARGYDGLAAIRLAAAADRPVLAVGQHDDHEQRRRALDAGAQRVLVYRKVFDDPGVIAAWLAPSGGPVDAPVAAGHRPDPPPGPGR